MDWAYERLDKLVESGEMTEEEAMRLLRGCRYLNDLPGGDFS